MKIALWIVQILLAVAFGGSGFMKLVTPLEDLSQMVGPWVFDMPELLVRFIGLSEVAGALGLILPALTRIQPRLTSLAAVGLIVVMILAAGFHATRGEFSSILPNIVLLLLAAFVAYGRTSLAPIEPRS
ncbi:DoxX family protein [Chloroflexi bacterium TSY]|nr:DoxX family protein [Chloroflexi bacterium TSY]